MTMPLYGSDSAPKIADSAPRAAQLLELRLFDVSTLWHMANMQVCVMAGHSGEKWLLAREVPGRVLPKI